MDSIVSSGAVVPPLFRIEVGNSLLVGVRRKRITADYIAEALELLQQLPLLTDVDCAEYVWQTTVEIAAAYELSLYDATSLESAIRLELPLATLDTRLAHAAEIAGVSSPLRNMRS